MKKYPSRPTALLLGFLLITSFLILPGCFGGDDEEIPETDPEISEEGATSDVERLTFYRLVEADDFYIQVPEDWETITTFTSSYPENTIVAFRNNNKNHDFIANVNIVRNTVDEGTTSADYALEMFEAVSYQLLNYKKSSQTEFDLLVGSTTVQTYLFEFEGTNDPTTETKQFIQLYAVNGTDAYIITGTYDKKDDELAIDQTKQTVQTFQLK